MKNSDQNPCRPTTGCCNPESRLDRRTFLKVSGAGTAGLMLADPVRAFAGPFGPGDVGDHLIPADKKLAPEWVASLVQRGSPRWFRGAELRHVGMPVGGICCGQLYLAGDGRLWHWDIFQSGYSSDYAGMSRGIHYATPMEPASPVQQGFAIRVGSGEHTQVRTLDRDGFTDVAFRGEYPVGRVTYADAECPVEVDLEAFSPFIPLDPDDSALPATVLTYRVKNPSPVAQDVELTGWLENRVCPHEDRSHRGWRVNRLLRRDDRMTVSCTAEAPSAESQESRPPILFADFEDGTYDGWTVEGTAFGERPFPRAELSSYHDVSHHEGEHLVNSHNTRGGEDVREGDRHTGTLTSDPFVLQRRFINFRIGGGRHPGKTCVNLLVNGEVVRTATGHDANRMRGETFDVAELEGQTAVLQVVDAVEGPWGNIGIDHIVFADEPVADRALEDLPGYGSMALTLLEPTASDAGAPSIDADASVAERLDQLQRSGIDRAEAAFGSPLVGALGRRFRLEPGQETEITFLVTWWFPYYPGVQGEFASVQDIDTLNRHYENRFSGASAVAAYVARHRQRLVGLTRAWNRTWYDSTLPYWLLDRTMIGLDCLATQTCHWFDNGRFYGWEGVICCPGTCQHVWNYAQALARIFPQLERTTRERVDYGIAFQESGELWYRAEAARHIAHDGQCGTILRAYREHTTAPDDAFLKRSWRRIRCSLEFLIEQDGGADGLLEGRQYNTLDQAWYGPMAWISSMYLAALAAGRQMASEMGDAEFAERCAQILAVGPEKLVTELFNGEHFIHRPPDHEATNTNRGCHIDQVFGQSLAHQVGLPRVVPRRETESALQALWKYNFAPDAGAYREAMQGVIQGGRWYAMPGEAGLVMCTWPTGGAEHASGNGPTWAVGYFNECMNGFEYQVATHMIHEGAPGSDLVEKGLAVTRAVHDRYAPDRRNPYNEIECSDHYSRSMASYGVFLACCGFEYHGPRGHIGFAPKLRPEDFRAPFTAAEGWGTFTQRCTDDGQVARLTLSHGRLRLRTVSLVLAPPHRGLTVGEVAISGMEPPRIEQDGDRVLLSLADEVVLHAGDPALEVVLRL